jgi:hypothetical protein
MSSEADAVITGGEPESVSVPGNVENVTIGPDDTDLPAETESVADEKTPAAEKEDSEPQPDAPAGPPAIDEELFSIAAAFGVSREEAQRFGDANSLERALQLVAARQNPPPNVGASQPPPTNGHALPDGAFALDLKKLNDTFEPELVQALVGINAHYANQTRAMAQQLAQVQGFVQEQSREQFVSRFDDLVTGLGDDYKHLFGEGPSAKLEGDSEAAENRVKLQKEMYELTVGHLTLHPQSKPDVAVIFRRALASAFSDQTQQAARKRVSEQLRSRSGQFMGRASGKSATPALTPEQRAAAFVRDFHAKLGNEEKPDLEL